MRHRRAHRAAQLVAWGRVAIGSTALIAPVAVTRPWVGGGAVTMPAQLLARTMGGRDLALGIGALRALSRSDFEARSWVALGGAADTIDALTTLGTFKQLPPRSRWAILALTVGAAVVSTSAVLAFDRSLPAT